MKPSEIIFSPDFVCASGLTIISFFLIPTNLSLEFCLSFYNIGITTLAIIFSIFFTALAIIMASSDNDFIEFLEEENDFSRLLDSFKITLIMLFVSLLYSLVLYMVTSYNIKNNPVCNAQHKTFFLVFEFLFSYSLFSTGLSVRDTITFSHFRIRFLRIRRNRKQEEK